MNLSSPAAVSLLLKKHDLRPRRRFGQNFLVDANTLQKIVDSANIFHGSQIVEIGSGLGVLTTALSFATGSTGTVVTIEIDGDLLPALQESIEGLTNVHSVFGDALKLDWESLNSQYFSDGPIKVVANIPYNITSPLLTMLLTLPLNIETIVLLVQKEVAERLSSPPGSDNYGSISVFAQYHSKVDVIGTVSRRVFVPAPDVDSAIIRLTPHKTRLMDACDEDLYLRIVRASFGQRRKSLINSLSGDPALGWDKPTASSILEDSGIDAHRRGETLNLGEFAGITRSAKSQITATESE